MAFTSATETRSSVELTSPSQDPEAQDASPSHALLSSQVSDSATPRHTPAIVKQELTEAEAAPSKPE